MKFATNKSAGGLTQKEGEMLITTQGMMNIARENAIERVLKLADTITIEDLDGTQEISTVGAKPVIIAALRNNASFIPAFSPAVNLDRALVNAGVPQPICDIYHYAMEGN